MPYPPWYKHSKKLINPHGLTKTFLSPNGSIVLKRAPHLHADPGRFETIVRAWERASELGVTPTLLRSERSKRSTFFEYEFVKGVDLYEWWSLHSRDRGRTESVRRAARTILTKLHRAGIVFGDVNAGNFIVDEHDRVWIVDWDTVSMVDDDLIHLNMMFERLGVQ